MPGLNNIFNSLFGGGIDNKNPAGETKLYEAVCDGDLSTVKKLLRKGADPDATNAHGMTPLHLAAYWGETRIIEILLQYHASPNADNGKGWTPLHSAALAGGMKSRKDIINKLKAAGAKSDIKDKNGWTAEDYILIWQENAAAAAKLKNIIDAQNNLTPPNPGQPPSKPKSGPHAPRH